MADNDKTRYVSLGFIWPLDHRKPRSVRLMIQDDTFGVLTLIDLSEHDFTAFMAGQAIKVEAEI